MPTKPLADERAVPQSIRTTITLISLFEVMGSLILVKNVKALLAASDGTPQPVFCGGTRSPLNMTRIAKLAGVMVVLGLMLAGARIVAQGQPAPLRPNEIRQGA